MANYIEGTSTRDVTLWDGTLRVCGNGGDDNSVYGYGTRNILLGMRCGCLVWVAGVVGACTRKSVIRPGLHSLHESGVGQVSVFA